MAPVTKFSDRSLFGAKTLYSSMLAGNETFAPPIPIAMDLLETQSLSSSQTSISFSSLDTYASDYEHLQIRAIVKTTANDSSVTCRINNDNTNSYASHMFVTNGGGEPGVIANTSTAYGRVGYLRSSSSQPGFSALTIDILDPFKASKNTTMRTLCGQASAESTLNIVSTLWINTNPVNTITFYVGTGNPPTEGISFQQFTRFSLYGIKGAN